MTGSASFNAESDALARRTAATEFDRSLVLEAGAGTGKTAVLVERVAAWCLGPGYDRAAARAEGGDPRAVAERVLDGVVALTFSEAAAAEMHERIAQRLVKVAAGGDARDVPTHGVERPAARARALLANLDRLSVRTIHAFCRRLLARFPVEAGLHPRFEIDMRAELRARVAREEIETLLRSDDTDERAVLAELSEQGVMAPDLERLLFALLGSTLSADEFAENPLASPALGAWWRRLRALCRVCSEVVPESAGPAQRRLGEALAATRGWSAAAAPSSSGDLVARLEALREIWRPASHALRSAGAQDPDWLALRRFLELAFRIDPACAVLLHAALAPRFARAQRRLRAEGGVTFDGLLRRTRDLLLDHPAVARQVRSGIAQLLVDEFQDTDPLQCEIVAELALRGESAERPVLFVVGDPKQSIYGWRNADLAAYDRFVADAVAHGAERHTLVVNYRSAAAVLREVERAIAPVMTRELGVQPAFQPLLPSSPVEAARPDAAGAGPAVEYWISDGDAARARDLEAAAIADDLVARHGRAGRPWASAAILLRSTGDLEHYLDALRTRGVPFAVDRDRIYYRRREVLEAAALLRAVLDPNDQLALVATLRSVRCGVPDAAWLPLWRAGFPETVRDALLANTVEPEATSASVARAVSAARAEVDALDLTEIAELGAWHESLRDFVALLVALRHSYVCEPFDQFLRRARRLALLDPTEAARPLGDHRLANLDRFFRELLHADDALSGDTAALLRMLRRGEPAEPEFDEGRPRDVSEDAVSVLTIHGAKGLAFDCVYLAQAHKGSANASGGVVEAGWIEGRVEYQLRWGPGRGQAVASLGFDLATARRAQVARAELVRTLYVAMTRARSRLVVAGRFGPASRNRCDTHADLLAKSLAGDLDRARRAAARSGASEVAVGERQFRFLAATAPERRRLPRRSGMLPADCVGRARLAAAGARERRHGAAMHSARPFSGAPSRAVGPGAGEPSRGARSPESTSSADSGVAARVGSAVHSFLEHFDWSGEEAESWARQWERTRTRLAAQTPPRHRAAALARARTLLEALRAGPLWPRMRVLAPHVLGREVPVLAPPDAPAVGPVGYWAGTIDLVYRDPQSGAIVVADYKTDRAIAPVASLAERYRDQGAVYSRAVADALGLQRAPRFELWFLAAHEIVVPA